MRHNPKLGGHAPGHLRDAMDQAINNARRLDAWWEELADEDVLSFYDPAMQRQWAAMSLPQRGRWLVGQLWHCTDILPGELVDTLGLGDSSSTTYAAAARVLRESLPDPPIWPCFQAICA
jgi:hypothetical protein